MRRAFRETGFTVIELLVSISLMALIGAALVSALSGGVKVWQRTQAFGTHRQAALIAFSQLRTDLQNAQRSGLVPFKGTYDEVAYAAIEEDAAADGLPVIGARGYFHDEASQRLCRAFVPYRRLRTQRLTGECQTVLEGVTRVRLGYFGANETSRAMGWHERWDSADLPMAVKVELTIQQERRAEPSTHAFVVFLTGSARTPG